MTADKWETLAELAELFRDDIPPMCAQINESPEQTIQASRALSKAVECLINATLLGALSPVDERADIFAAIEQIIRGLDQEESVLILSAALIHAATAFSLVDDMKRNAKPLRWWERL